MRTWLAAALVLGGAAALACGGSDDELFLNDQQPGHKGQPCFENGTCNPPLTCVSNVCVDLSEVQGGQGGAAGQAGSGTAGTGTAGTTTAGAGGEPAGAGGEGPGGEAGQGGSEGPGGQAGDAGQAGSATAGSAGSPTCVGADYPAKQPPATFVVVVDRSSSMNKNERWQKLATGVVKALDEDLFDGMHVGLLLSPTPGKTPPPMCAAGGAKETTCGAAAPEPAIGDTGTDKSTGFSGIRSKIKTVLTATGPAAPDAPDAMPLYASVEQALSAAQGSMDEKRVVVVLSDGSPGCNGDTGREGFADCTGCMTAWENPNNVVGLVAAARASFGIQTAMVGLPGSQDFDPKGCETPAYAMQLGFSAIAYAGSELVPPGCTGTTFFPGGGVPTMPCHRDLSQDGGPPAIAAAIVKTRTQALGCTFTLPDAGGGTIDLSKVNVKLRLDQSTSVIPRRSSAGDTCDDAPCWDLTDDTHAVLVGKACSAYMASGSPGVSFSLGCPTTFK